MLKEDVELPEGLKDGQKLKVPQMGHAADVYTSVAGDLLINLKVKPHEFYERDDTTIKSEVELTLSEAILGAKITISTVHGPLNIKVEPGVCSGDTMVLKHYGVPEFEPPDHYDAEELRGDHIVTFKVNLPSYNPNEADQTDMDRLLK